MSLKHSIENLLRDYPVLFRFGSRFYHWFNSSFKTLSPGTPEAILKSFEILKKEQRQPFGDYYEFGLFRGYAFLKAFEHCQKLGLDEVRFHGFDSFKGLPPAEGIDTADGRFFEGQFACSRADVEKNLAANGMDMSRTLLVEGYYEESLTESLHDQHEFKPAAVVLLDCDYYSSTVEALNWLDRYLSDGCILLFDDWFSYGDDDQLGQPKAFEEFLQRRKDCKAEQLWRFGNHGNAYRLKLSG
ncbi:MAG: hypothetical protein HKN85_00955 [Gammaproteobacteria bacterium]|nr:hypothetical protein [Gammaproteobacteria bacterium]